MTTEPTENSPARENPPTSLFNRLTPWLIAGLVFLIFLITLNHWVSLRSLPLVARVTGWDWRPNFTTPLYTLLTSPLHLLSGSAELFCLNLFSAVCAFLSLTLLARCVSLLPQDHTREQRLRGGRGFSVVPQNWFPMLIAVLVCGLQLTFWENSVVASTEMLDLLVFAYVVRCLLEFRVLQKESWLIKFVIVYGIGVASNWAMIGFFPLFLIALIWIKGASFFNLKFLAKMMAFGVIGLLFYFLIPILSTNSQQTYLQELHNYLGGQKNYLKLPFGELSFLRSRLFMISATSVFPLLMIAIRWPSFEVDTSRLSSMVTAFVFRLIHIFFLAVCIVVSLDFAYSARILTFEIFPFLPFYFLTALAVGYFVSYALLVFGRQPERSWDKTKGLLNVANKVALVAVVIGVSVVPVLLVKNNFAPIKEANNSAVERFAAATESSLPKSNSVILSDDPSRIYLLKAIYAQQGQKNNNIVLETGSLLTPSYHQFIYKNHPNEWPLSTNELTQPGLLSLMLQLHKTRSVYYLHPSFGYYFETFYPIPHKLVYELQPYPTNSLVAPAQTETAIKENQNFWNSFIQSELPALSKIPMTNKNSGTLVVQYARSLDFWGTKLQQSKLLKEAGQAFAAAYALNSQNVAAEVNRDFNLSYQKGETRPVKPDAELSKKLGQYRNWEMLLSWNGPFDEPDFCSQTGEVFGKGGNLRQSAQNFIRSLELSPKNIPATLGLAKTYVQMGLVDDGKKLIEQIRQSPEFIPSNTNLFTETLRIESFTYLAKNDLAGAERFLKNTLAQNPKDLNRIGLLTQFYVTVGQYTNALASAQSGLKLAPDDKSALFTEAVLDMQLGRFADAIPLLDRLIKIQPDNHLAKLNRAIANLRTGKFSEAKAEYERLLDLLPKMTYQIYYGLAKIAENAQQTSEEIKNLKLYLQYGPKNSQEYADVNARLVTLQGKK